MITVYCVDIGADNTGLLKEKAAYAAFLSPEKLPLYNASAHNRSSLISCIGELLVKALYLNAHLDVRAEAVSIGYGVKGKPYIKGDNSWHYSLSHTGDSIVIALSDHVIGVDAELYRSVNPSTVRKYFNADESSFLEDVSSEREKRYTEIWTRKEAYLKYTGEGLSGGLASVSSRSGGFKSFLRPSYVVSVYPAAEGEPLEILELDAAAVNGLLSVLESRK